MIPVAVSLLSARKRGLPPDLRLNGLLYLPDSPSSAPVPALLVCHGASSRASQHTEFCVEACSQGFVVLALDFRGHGDSEGSGDGPLEQDVLAAARFLREHPAVDPEAVCYRGSSMGGFYGLKAAPAAGFSAMVLICPAGEETMLAALAKDAPESQAVSEASTTAGSPTTANTTRWDRTSMRAYFARQNTRALARQVRCPVLLVHARPDSQVPIAHSAALARQLAGNVALLALEEGSHSSAQHDPVVHVTSLAWLRAQLDARHGAPGRR